MSYYLWKAVLGATPRVPIEKDEYDDLLVSWGALGQIALIEEGWDDLVQNYLELEMELLQSAMRTMVLNHEDYHEFQQTRLRFARRLSNLLQSCKSYIDHTPHHLNQLPVAGLVAAFKGFTNVAYDASFSYRFMEALRNYAQHRGLPLHGATFDAAWTGDFSDEGKNKGQMRHSVAASIDISKIKGDKKFKASVIAEIDAHLDQLDVAILVREYIESLAGVHTELRKALKVSLDGWKASVRTAIGKYSAVNDGNVIGLTAAIFDDDEHVVARTNLFDDLPTRVEKLVRRNGSLVNLRLRYVTNEITPKRAAKRVADKKS